MSTATAGRRAAACAVNRTCPDCGRTIRGNGRYYALPISLNLIAIAPISPFGPH
ncbi:hypothetical protein GCM10012285_27800 [Streptomyces kronopolitis]|uniref:Transposase n=1 Tax=Streptomyces kronopolitis TaxID=1612435 RepID=A0ABQ2JGJ2_9ACTN|nr:hypothetical protein [Streptomyces kronopolitis]GGN44823.1 hypothetical protein GCM10012285_27800 [Streptomyces kronopolitis]